MSETKVSWLLCIYRLVSKTDNVMYRAHLVKQVSLDYVFMTNILPSKTGEESLVVK